MKLVEYMYRSQIPQLLSIIDMYQRSIELRRTLIGRQHQVLTYLYCTYLDEEWASKAVAGCIVTGEGSVSDPPADNFLTYRATD